ncbi:hypothetical protein PoHVEF18_002239 [Penicillium ochrochloron]
MGDRIIGLNDEEIIIGAEIPPIKVMTMEGRYGILDQLEHNTRYIGLIQKLSSSREDDDGANSDLDKTAGRQNIGVMRQLALLGFNPRLDDFLQGVDSQDAIRNLLRFSLFYSILSSHFLPPPSSFLLPSNLKFRRDKILLILEMSSPDGTPSPEATNPAIPPTPEYSRAIMSNKSSLVARNREISSIPAERRRSNSA